MGTHSASLRGGANTCVVEHRGDPLRAASAGRVGNDQDLGRAIRAVTKLNLFSLISRSGLNSTKHLASQSQANLLKNST